ncbi:iron transporter [bacterium]|nr:iron transporter [bacterium]
MVNTPDELQPGERGRIIEVSGEDAITVRLMEMGLTDGEEIELIGRAPLGDPLEFAIRGYRLSLRTEEARRISIERLQ